MPVDPGQPLSTRSLPAGDAINVAIFLPNELEGGLARLTAGGYITEHEGAFAPTDKALAYSGSSRHRRAMLKELRDVQRMLASRSTEPPGGYRKIPLLNSQWRVTSTTPNNLRIRAARRPKPLPPAAASRRTILG